MALAFSNGGQRQRSAGDTDVADASAMEAVKTRLDGGATISRGCSRPHRHSRPGSTAKATEISAGSIASNVRYRP